MSRETVSRVAFPLLVAGVVLVGLRSTALAAGLNTDVALTPPKGGTIVRAQARQVRLRNDPTALGREIDLYLGTATAVYGVSERLAVFGTLRLLRRDVDFAMGGGSGDTGFADIPLLVKYRFFQKDEPGVTTRWAVIGGLEIPTFDNVFSSDSVDPVIGMVWTHQERKWWIDWDLLYKFNTAGGLAGDDELRADVAYSLRLSYGATKKRVPWALYAVAEINARYLTDGSYEVLGSPGLQYITPRFIVEAGVQLPIGQDFQAPRLETGLVVVLSLRFQF